MRSKTTLELEHREDSREINSTLNMVCLLKEKSVYDRIASTQKIRQDWGR